MILLVFLIGLFLSAFFSGSETGFYRATRTRFALDALSGDPVSRWLIWLTNNPSLFVATTLVGNNLSNYVTSWAIVAGTGILLTDPTAGMDLAVSVLLSPLIFIYGELMPKNLFFAAPNRLLRLAGPMFMVFTALFAPLAAILFGLGRLLEWIIGESPERLQLRLARRELQRVLSEGHEAGVLLPSQRRMADGMFELATMPLDKFVTPASKLCVVRESMSAQEILRIARNRKSPIVYVQNEQREWVGYYHVIDLELQPEPAPVRRLNRVARGTSPIAALTSLQEQDQPCALVIGDQGSVQGLISVERLAAVVLDSD